MSNEVSYQIQLLLSNGDLRDNFSSGGKADNQTSQFLVRNVQEIGFAAHEALGLGDVTSLGYAVFQNLDDTNYVEVGIDVGATFYPFVKLEPGKLSLVRLGTNVPYALADTAAVKLFYVIYST